MFRWICGVLLIQAAVSVPLNLEHGERDLKDFSHIHSSTECDVGIVGGGISGLYMAYQLLDKKKEKNVCVFEQESRLGGRIKDHRFKEAPDIYVGLGAWRIDKKQPLMIALLEELGIGHTDWNFVKPSLQESRGIKANNHESLKKAYPNLKSHPLFGNMTSHELLNYALKPEHVAKASNFATVNRYFSHHITPEGTTFLSELYGFMGDFKEFTSPESFIEFEKETKHFSWQYVRPEGGMSEIIQNLAKKIVDMGGKIYTRSPVKRLEKKDEHYILITSQRQVRSRKLVVALTPKHIENVEGNVTERIKSTAQLLSIQPIPAFKGSAVFDKAWWENVTLAGTPVVQEQLYISCSNCLGTSFVFRGNASNGTSVVNTMYNDGECSRRWRDIGRLGRHILDREVHRALEMKYGSKIPKPSDTVYQFWDSAWHFQKPGTNFTLKDIAKWAKRPFPGEDIFLVNEAYHPLRGWSEGAISACQNALKEGWGMIFPIQGNNTAVPQS